MRMRRDSAREKSIRPTAVLFGTVCTPETPIGSCMVSSEGACAAYLHLRKKNKEIASIGANKMQEKNIMSVR